MNLQDLHAAEQSAAAEVDQGAEAAYQAQARAMAAISPRATGPLLQALFAMLEGTGAAVEGHPTTLADPEVARALSAVADLTEDAAEQQVIDPALVLDLGELVDDKGAQLAAGKLRALLLDREFRRWLASPSAKSPEPPASLPPASDRSPAAPDNTDALFASRMGS